MKKSLSLKQVSLNANKRKSLTKVNTEEEINPEMIGRQIYEQQ
jgi:hypothetical protein